MPTKDEIKSWLSGKGKPPWKKEPAQRRVVPGVYVDMDIAFRDPASVNIDGTDWVSVDPKEVEVQQVPDQEGGMLTFIVPTQAKIRVSATELGDEIKTMWEVLTDTQHKKVTCTIGVACGQERHFFDGCTIKTLSGKGDGFVRVQAPFQGIITPENEGIPVKGHRPSSVVVDDVMPVPERHVDIGNRVSITVGGSNLGWAKIQDLDIVVLGSGHGTIKFTVAWSEEVLDIKDGDGPVGLVPLLVREMTGGPDGKWPLKWDWWHIANGKLVEQAVIGGVVVTDVKTAHWKTITDGRCSHVTASFDRYESRVPPKFTPEPESDQEAILKVIGLARVVVVNPVVEAGTTLVFGLRADQKVTRPTTGEVLPLYVLLGSVKEWPRVDLQRGGGKVKHFHQVKVTSISQMTPKEPDTPVMFLVAMEFETEDFA